MSMNIFDPNECVNKEKYPVCMHWTKKIYVNMYTMYMYKNKFKIFKVYNSQVKSLFTNAMRII